MAPKMNGTKAEFVEWIKGLVADTKKCGAQYIELYHHCLHAFTEADANYDGHIDLSEFDLIIEMTAFQPRKYGFAPSEKDLYKTDAERIAVRMKLFEKIDRNCDGVITFDEFLDYVYDHIVENSNAVM